jgi:hypothetical protein
MTPERFRTIMDALGVETHGLARMSCAATRGALVRWKSGARPIPADAAEWLESVMRDPPQDIVEWYEEMARNPPPFLRGRPREETT